MQLKSLFVCSEVIIRIECKNPPSSAMGASFNRVAAMHPRSRDGGIESCGWPLGAAQHPQTHRDPQTHPPPRQPASNHHNGSRLESRRSHVRSAPPQLAPRPPQLTSSDSYNRYISVASRVVRRSLKEDKRIAAERRGESELRFAKWEVSLPPDGGTGPGQRGANSTQNGKQGEIKELNEATLSAQAAAKVEASA